MFSVEDKVFTWSRTSFGRGKRTEEVRTGCYVIDHIATGQLITGVSDTVSATVDGLIIKLDLQTYPNKKFVKTCTMDADLRLYEFPTKSVRQAKALEKRIRESTYPQYLLKN